MLRSIGISAFLLVAAVPQAFAEVAYDTAELSEHVAEHASGGLPQLDPSSYPSQIFWLVVVFTFMYIFFSKKTVPQYSRTIEDRAERITSDLDQAARLKDEVAELQASYEDKLAQAREESYLVFASSEKKIKTESDKRAADFQERSRKKIEDLEQNIQGASDAAMNEMGDVAVEIAIQASKKIIGISVDEKTAKAVVKSLNKVA